MRLLIGVAVILFGAGAIFLLLQPRLIAVQSTANSSSSLAANNAVSLPSLPEARLPTVSANVPRTLSADIPNQPQLANPPEVIRAIYLTSWSAGSATKLNSLINLIKERGLNAAVIDIKDYSGYVAYAMDVPEVKASGAENELRILRPNALIKQLHDNNIYIIGRITVFQDPILAKAHPEWALGNKITGRTWTDRAGLSWLDPAAESVWDYNIAIARDALNRGFDEINFDYVRFASDGDLSVISHPFWDGETAMHLIIKKFFKYLREQLSAAKLSVDLFGLATVNPDDLGIGQVIEDAYQYFDYVSPMVYPSHYSPGFLGYQNPAKYPYEVIKYSLERALERLKIYDLGFMNSSSTTETLTDKNLKSELLNLKSNAKLRPWLQAFDLGAVYNASMINREIQAVDDVLNNSSTSSQFAGWLLWDPANNYSNFKP